MNNRTKNFILKILGSIVIIVIGAVGWTGFKVWRAWDALSQGEFDTVASREALQTITATVTIPEDADPPPPDLLPAPPAPQPDSLFDAFLAVGSDTRPGFGGARADVILLVLLPTEDRQAAIVSLPRDLYIENPCTLGYSRINVNLNGCSSNGVKVSGPELLAIAVEQFTGIKVDHFALFGFDGFAEVIDEVGGIEICLDHAVRDEDAELELAAGCHNATGAQTLSWVRSRKTQELVDNQWRTMRGVSDLTRNERQQDVMIQLLGRLKKFRSIGDLLDTIQSLANAFTVDEGLSLSSAARLAWSQRGLDAADILRLKIPVKNYTTRGGAAVLLPTVSFTEILEQTYGGPTAVGSG